MSLNTDEQITLLKTAVLSEQRDFLCQNITPKVHYPYLRSRYLLSEEDEEVIEAQLVRRQKVHKFIDLLVKKGDKAFDEFLKSIIQERTQIFIADELQKAYEEKKRRLDILLSSVDKSNKSCEYVHVTTISDGSNTLSPQINQLRKSQKSEPCSLSSRIPSTISDLGVDTDKLPKPVMPPKFTAKTDDVIRYSGDISYLREKSIEENEDKSARKSSASSSNA